MNTTLSKVLSKAFYKITIYLVVAAFSLNSIIPIGYAQPATVQTTLNLPSPGTMVSVSQPFTTPIMKGLKIHPENPFEFDFIIDTGHSGLQGEALKEESAKLIKYFLASLTIPQDKLWVNLSPYEKDKIIPQEFGTTEMGRDLLSQDYILKQLTASLIYPEDDLGRKFWERIYKRAFELYGTTDIPVNTFNKVWIVPDKARVYESKGAAYVIESHLKVMLEEDYLSVKHNIQSDEFGTDQLKSDDVQQVNRVSSAIVKEVILPEIEKEINEGKNFANLRQIYQSLILAIWYKQNLQESLLNKAYSNKSKTFGIEMEDKNTKQQIYEQYLEAFKQGVYSYIKEDYDPLTQEVIPRKYFAGGFEVPADFRPATVQAVQDSDLGTQGPVVLVQARFNRMEHERYHEAGQFSQVIQSIASEIGITDYDPLKGYDLTNAVRRAGGKISSPQRELRLEDDGILVVIDKRFEKDHAGRGSYQLAVYARDEAKAQHELAELREVIVIALDSQEKIATEADILAGRLGERLRVWANDANVSVQEKIRRQNWLIKRWKESHVKGLIAEGKIEEAQGYQENIKEQELTEPITNFDITIAGDGGDKFAQLMAFQERINQGDIEAVKELVSFMGGNWSIWVEYLTADTVRSLQRLAASDADAASFIAKFSPNFDSSLVNDEMFEMTRAQALTGDKDALYSIERFAVMKKQGRFQRRAYAASGEAALQGHERALWLFLDISRVKASFPFPIELGTVEALEQAVEEEKNRDTVSYALIEIARRNPEFREQIIAFAGRQRAQTIFRVLSDNPQILNSAATQIQVLENAFVYLTARLKDLESQGRYEAGLSDQISEIMERMSKMQPELKALQGTTVKALRDITIIGDVDTQIGTQAVSLLGSMVFYDRMDALEAFEQVIRQKGVDESSGRILKANMKRLRPQTMQALMDATSSSRADSFRISEVFESIAQRRPELITQGVVQVVGGFLVRQEPGDVSENKHMSYAARCLGAIVKNVPLAREDARSALETAMTAGSKEAAEALAENAEFIRPETIAALEKGINDLNDALRSPSLNRRQMTLGEHPLGQHSRKSAERSSIYKKRELLSFMLGKLVAARPDFVGESVLETLKVCLHQGGPAQEAAKSLVLISRKSPPLREKVIKAFDVALYEVVEDVDQPDRHLKDLDSPQWISGLDVWAAEEEWLQTALVSFLDRSSQKERTIIAAVKRGDEREPQSEAIEVLLKVAAKRAPQHGKKITLALLKLLEEDREVYQDRPRMQVGFGVIEAIQDRFRYALRDHSDFALQAAPLFIQRYIENPSWRETLKSFLKLLPAAAIAKHFKVNIKVARYLKESVDFEKVLDDEFRETINEIAYNLNREETLHPAERRLGEDEKMSLFDSLFGDALLLSFARDTFNTYFRNDPQSYTIDIPQINKLLANLTLDQIKRIIRAVLEDPKQSLDEIAEDLKETLQGQPNAEFVLREMQWILSNLFVLQDKIESLSPIVAALEAQKKTQQDLIGVLEAVDKANTFAELNTIAQEQEISVLDLIKFKLESVGQHRREVILVSSLQAVSGLAADQAQEVFQELTVQFSYQSQESRERIFFKLLFSTDTDNAVLVKTINEMKEGKEISAKNISPFVRQFLTQYRNFFIDNEAFNEFLGAAQELEAQERKEAFKQARKLYGDRQYSARQLPQGVSAVLPRLEGRITPPQMRTQVPHVFYEPLLKLEASEKSLETFRQLISALNGNQTLRNQLATLKNTLFEQMGLFSAIKYPGKVFVFSGIILVLVQRMGPPSVENCEKFYQQLVIYLEKFSAICRQAGSGLNSPLVNLAKEIVDELLRTLTINDEKLEGFIVLGKSQVVDQLLNALKGKIKVENEKDVLNKMREYVLKSPQFKWSDHRERDIFALIGIYLSNIDDPEIVQNIFSALMAEIDGKFKEWKYQSEDYLETLDEIIRIEIDQLSDEEKEEIEAELERAEGKTLYEKLQSVPGFEDLKERVAKVRNWEETLSEGLGDGLIAEFTDDFYTLFNIGNYPGSTACQSCTYGSNLNRGLAGYLVNGTNKAITLLDKDRRVVSTRRVVRLRIMEDENGKKQPVIFVEEKARQFGTKHIDRLYGMLKNLSDKTGLPIVFEDDPILRDKKELSSFMSNVRGQSLKVVLFPGRSTYDYSDTYGEDVPGKIQAGLYRQAPTKKVTAGEVIDDNIEKPVAVIGEGEKKEVRNTVVLRSMPLMVKSAGVVMESRFDLNIAVLGADATDEELKHAESLPNAHMVQIVEPSPKQQAALGPQGYFYKPRKITHALTLPVLQEGQTVDQAMEEYYNRFDSKHRRQFKKDTANIDGALAKGELELVVDGGESAEGIEDFLKLYVTIMDEKERGRKPLLEDIEKEKVTPQEFLRKGRVGIYLKKDGKVIGGIVARKFSDHYSISYSATDTRIVRGIQSFLVQTLMRQSIMEGLKRLNYGVDTNLYGHHLSTGLMQFKTGLGFQPQRSANSEMIKITNFSIFDMPVFFYDYDAEGNLRSTLIITPEMAIRVRDFEDVTPELRVYVLRDGKPVLTSREELATVNSSRPTKDAGGEVEVTDSDPGLKVEEDLKGGIDLNPTYLNLKTDREQEGFSIPINTELLQNIRIDGLSPVIIRITPVTNLPLILGVTAKEAEQELSRR